MESIIQMLGTADYRATDLYLEQCASTESTSNRRMRSRKGGERAMSESDDTPPPFMEDFPFETQLEQMILQEDEKEETSPVVAEEPARPEAEQSGPVVEEPQPQPPPVPVESPTRIRSVPGTSLLNLSPQTFRQGIILSEILGRPEITPNKPTVSHQPSVTRKGLKKFLMSTYGPHTDGEVSNLASKGC